MRRYLPVVFALIVGVAVGFVAGAGKSPGQTRDTVPPVRIRIQRTTPIPADAITLTPYKVVVNGRSTSLREAPLGSATVWRVEIGSATEETTVFASQD